MAVTLPTGRCANHPILLAAILAIVGVDAGDSTGRLSGNRPSAAQSADQEFVAANVCIGCHSPATGPPLSGAQLGRWLGPNISPDPVSGIGAWSRDDLFRYLRHGNAPGRGQAGGPMAPIVTALQDRPDADLHALIDWLARQPPHRDPSDRLPASEQGEKLVKDPALLRPGRPGAPDEAPSGAALYNTACASCHGSDGAGSPDGHFPSMFHNSAVGRRTNLVAVLLSGVERHVKGGTVFMQGFDGTKGVVGGLSDEELATLVNFVVKQFGDAALATVKPEDIQGSRLEWRGEGTPAAAQGQRIAVGAGRAGPRSLASAAMGSRGRATPVRASRGWPVSIRPTLPSRWPTMPRGCGQTEP